MKELLEKEKQQIIDAAMRFANENGVEYSDIEDYYNETYNNQTK